MKFIQIKNRGSEMTIGVTLRPTPYALEDGANIPLLFKKIEELIMKEVKPSPVNETGKAVTTLNLAGKDDKDGSSISGNFGKIEKPNIGTTVGDKSISGNPNKDGDVKDFKKTEPTTTTTNPTTKEATEKVDLTKKMLIRLKRKKKKKQI